jgi:hypothetical protein
MTEPSKFSAKGLSILISIPLIQGNDVVGNYADIVNSYNHTISSSGGFTSASFTLVGNYEFLEDWLQSGLGRHVQVFGPAQQVVWEGFVNDISINMGAATFSRGPLVNVGNRVLASYTPIFPCEEIADPPCNAPVTGTPTTTVLVDDDFSKKRYGIWEKIVDAGEQYIEDAEFIRDLFLTENSYPEGNPALSIGSEGDMSVTVNCKGYIEWLSAYPYIYDNGTDVCISLWASDKIIDILQDDPNGIISNLYDSINWNGVAVCDNEVDYKLAKTIIDDILTFGGGDGNRWTFGVYNDRKVVYAPAPTEIEYVYYKTGVTQQVETLSGAIIEPWDVRPCKWVGIPTFLSSFGLKIEDVRNDPRVFFGEEVNFTAPDQVTISGAKIRKLPQLLARMGLGGG